MTDTRRRQTLDRLGQERRLGRPIVASGAGTGLVARVADSSDVDLIVVYASGRFRMDGFPSILGALPVANANDVMLDMGRRSILPVVAATPVVGGVYGLDLTKDMDELLATMSDIGYSGVINFPTVGRIDGGYRRDLEDLGLGIDREIDMLGRARDHDLLSMAYVYTSEEATAFVEGGVDVVVGHGGVTGGGDVGHSAPASMDTTIDLFTDIFAAARSVDPDVFLLTHGGPIVTPEDASRVNGATGAHGFMGASSMERIPVEQALRATFEAFKTSERNTP